LVEIFRNGPCRNLLINIGRLHSVNTRGMCNSVTFG